MSRVIWPGPGWCRSCRSLQLEPFERQTRPVSSNCTALYELPGRIAEDLVHLSNMVADFREQHTQSLSKPRVDLQQRQTQGMIQLSPGMREAKSSRSSDTILGGFGQKGRLQAHLAWVTEFPVDPPEPPARAYTWKELASGEISQAASAATPEALFQLAEFRSPRVNDPIQGFLAVSVKKQRNLWVEVERS